MCSLTHVPVASPAQKAPAASHTGLTGAQRANATAPILQYSFSLSTVDRLPPDFAVKKKRNASCML